MYLRLLKMELFRMMWNRGFVATVLVVTTLITLTLYAERPDPLYDSAANTVRIGLLGAFGINAPILYTFVAPAIAGLVASGSLAADVRRGYPDLLRVRGVTSPGYLTVKALAMFSAAALGTFLPSVLSVTIALLYLPLRPTTSKIPVEPFSHLFASNPAGYDLLVSALLSLGAGALALSGLAVGSVLANEYAAAACPFVLTVSLALFAGASPSLRPLQPEFYLNLREGYGTLTPQWQTLAAPLYWTCFSLLCLVVGAYLYKRVR